MLSCVVLCLLPSFSFRVCFRFLRVLYFFCRNNCFLRSSHRFLRLCSFSSCFSCFLRLWLRFLRPCLRVFRSPFLLVVFVLIISSFVCLFFMHASLSAVASSFSSFLIFVVFLFVFNCHLRSLVYFFSPREPSFRCISFSLSPFSSLSLPSYPFVTFCILILQFFRPFLPFHSLSPLSFAFLRPPFHFIRLFFCVTIFLLFFLPFIVLVSVSKFFFTFFLFFYFLFFVFVCI